MPNFKAEALSDFIRRIFEAAGVPTKDAATVAGSLVGSNLRGHDSHGVMRVPQYVEFLEKGNYRIDVELRVESETPALLVCDGQWGLGQVQAHRLVDIILPKARQVGLAAGLARDFGHIGRLGEYAERATDVGMVLLATVNNCGAGQRVAPPGGLGPRLGTNPLCIGAPTSTDPLVLDFGTSVAAEGKVRVHHINQTRTPEGWLLDAEGRPTTDPGVLYEQPPGSIMPMGGAQTYKGFGLALLLDLLAGGLTGGRSSHPGAGPVRGNNLVFVVFDPSRWGLANHLRDESSTLTTYVRATPRLPGVESITLPGDPERRTLAERSRTGIPLAAAHWERLTELATRLSVATINSEA